MLFFNEKIIINDKQHFASGVDDAFLAMSFTMIFLGIALLLNYKVSNSFEVILLQIYIVGLLLSIVYSIRYVDNFYTILAFVCLAGIMFSAPFLIGGILKKIIPFILFFSSVGFLVLIESKYKLLKDSLFGSQIELLRYLFLVLIIVSINHFVVKELTIAFFNLSLQEGEDIPLGWLFLGLTIVVPIVLLSVGLKFKKTPFYRIGFLGILIFFPTLTLYLGISNLERGLTIGGFTLISVALSLFYYLKSEKFGFTVEKLHANSSDTLLKNIIVLSTVSVSNSDETIRNETDFKGGDFGGAGAGGDY